MQYYIYMYTPTYRLLWKKKEKNIHISWRKETRPSWKENLKDLLVGKRCCCCCCCCWKERRKFPPPPPSPNILHVVCRCRCRCLVCVVVYFCFVFSLCYQSFSGSVTVTMAGTANAPALRHGQQTGNVKANTNSQTHTSSEQLPPVPTLLHYPCKICGK